MKKSCFYALAAVLLASMAKADTTMTYSGPLPTEQTVLFQNANLLAVKGLSLDGYQKFGGFTDTRTYTIYEGEESTGAPSSGYYKNSSLFGYANSGTTLTVEFHGHNSYGYNGIGNGFELKLTQSGSDILGEVTWMAGFTGANDYENLSWEAKKKSNFNDWNSSSATYSTCGSNLTLFFRETESHTVTFVDWNGNVLDTQTVAFGADAIPPPSVDLTRPGYVFAGWDTAFTAVTENLTVTAVYHQLFTVTFRDADGTVLDTQTVEEGMSATEPDMTGRTYGGNPFSGWDADFSSISGDFTVTAVYAVTPADVAAVIDGGQLPEGALVWGGGASGIWNDTTANWYNLNKVTRPWSAGAVAVFPCAAAVAVSGPKQVGGVLFATAGAVALSGDALMLADGSSVTLNGKFAVLSNDVSSAGSVSFVCNDIDESLRSWNGVLTFDDALLFPGASIADISNLTLRMKGKFGGERPVATLTTDIDSNGNGIHFYSADATQISGQAKVKTNNGYGGVWEVIKFVLTEKADGIHGHVEYVCGGTGSGGWTADVDMDPETSRPNSGDRTLVTAPEDDNAAWDAAHTYAGAIYAISYHDANTTYIAPEVQLGGTVACSALTVGENLTVRLVGGGCLGESGTYSGDLTVDGTLAFAGDNAQTIKGKRAGNGRYLVAEGGSAVFDCGSGGSWANLAIAGNATVNGYWTLPGDKGATRVLPGGIVDLRSFYTQYGPQGSAPLYIHTNGLVRLTRGYSIGRGKPFHAIGGVIAEVTGGTQDQLAQHVYLSNGADFIGTKVGVGDAASDWSILSASGEAPSFFSVTNLVVGLLGTVNANNRALGVKIAVDDVTGDGQTDLTIRSILQERANTTARYNEGFRGNCGLWKTGDGTVEFTASGSCATSGVFNIEAGTVRFPEAAAGDFGALIVLGDSEIEVARGARITFDASSDFAWTEGKTLVFSGTMGRKSVRIGTSAAALTAEQLAAVKFRSASGRLRPMAIDGDGYLMAPSKGVVISVR